MDSDSDYKDIDGEEDKENDSSTSRCEVIDKNKNEDEENVDYYLDMSNQVKTNDYLHEVLDAGEVVKHMSDRIKEVNIILQLPSTFTRVLLNHFKWDEDKLVARFYEGDEDKLFSDVKILLPFKSQIASANEPSECSSNAKVKISANECEICFLPVTANIMMGVQCGHAFCDSCWDEYLTKKIMDEGSVEIIKCAGHGCNSLVDDETVMKLVKDPNVKSKYQHLITKSFVECNKLLHWCTEPNCNYVIKVQHFESKPVTCKCSNVFCFDCGENWHDPVQCKWLKSWIKKCNDDGETFKWLAANTKNCPNCQEATEKVGGCNHMTCNKCGYEYCWMCMGIWTEHKFNNFCNKFDMNAFIDQTMSRPALDHFLFYFNRYDNHMKSLKFEHRLYLSEGMKMEEEQRYNTDVPFLKNAVDVLCQCRQTLMYTYVFAFYLQNNNQSIIFEDNQKDLERATEQLSRYLEDNLTFDKLVNIKQEVKDQFNYCESRRKVLLDHVYEGYDKDLWLYQENTI